MSEGVTEKVRAAGGEIYGITSEPQALASRAQSAWKLDFETVGDPHHEIANACHERGWLSLYVNERLDFLRNSAPDGLDWEPTHPKGYFQPGVLALDASGTALYRWRGVPTHRNMGGATERPTPTHLWESVARGLDAPQEGRTDAALDENPPLDSRGAPWPVFVALLIANGWFVEPRGFGNREGGPSPLKRIRNAALRLLGFAGAWLAAFAWLPTLPVAVALVGWIVWIVPKVRFLNAEFQDARSA